MAVAGCVQGTLACTHIFNMQCTMHNYMQCVCNCEHYGDHRVCMSLSDAMEDLISMRHGWLK